MGVITRDPRSDQAGFNVKSEDAYMPYDGKIVRHIWIQRVGFARTVIDTSRHFESFIAKAADAVHSKTREFVVHNNLFVKEGKPLNAYRVADNERTLRNLDYILDARIFVKPVAGSSDSVDLVVITRDVFSLGATFQPSFPEKYYVSVQDINLGGYGQTLKFGQLYDITRMPRYGYEAMYLLSNIGGSFIDGSIGYTKLNSGVSIGNENENSFYVRLNRPLYHPFARLAGGMEISNNVSANVYRKPDSLFARYHYNIQDFWAGYSFGHRRMPRDLKENRNRKFIALRAFDQEFLSSDNTSLTELDRYIYRTKTSVLGQLTFFRQDFYKTQYVVGFGRTEDIPYGYRASLTAGWERELGNKRPYLGGELYYNKVRPGGTILTYNGKLASYWNNMNSEDGLFQIDFTRFSKIIHAGRTIIRHQTQAGYAALFNQKVKRGIDIRDINGITGFMPDSLVGLQRLTFSHETVVYTPWKFFGLRLAPLARVDLAMIKRQPGLLRTRNLFSGISLGLRARNENLIFNTIEARLYYYPRTVEGIDHFKFTITTNLRVKYPTNLVNKPSTVFP